MPVTADLSRKNYYSIYRASFKEASLIERTIRLTETAATVAVVAAIGCFAGYCYGWLLMMMLVALLATATAGC